MAAAPGTSPRVVVGVDGSDCSKQALRLAARIAAAESADLEVIGTWEYPVASGWQGLTRAQPMKPDIDKALTEAVDEVFGPDRPPNLHVAAVEGDAARILLDASHGAAMLVVGNRGRGGFRGLLLGSVSAKVAEHAACPVLIVRPSGTAPASPAG